MTPEQLTIADYHKGNVSTWICVDTLLTSIIQSHPKLHQLLYEDCTTELAIAIMEEILEYKEQPLPVNTCPNCKVNTYGYEADNTNLAECNKCGTFFKLVRK